MMGVELSAPGTWCVTFDSVTFEIFDLNVSANFWTFDRGLLDISDCI